MCPPFLLPSLLLIEPKDLKCEQLLNENHVSILFSLQLFYFIFHLSLSKHTQKTDGQSTLTNDVF